MRKLRRIHLVSSSVIASASLTLPAGHGSVPGVSSFNVLNCYIHYLLYCSTEFSAVPDLDEFPNVKMWMELLLQRAGFERGRNVPGPHFHITLNESSEEHMNELAKARGGWVQDGMKRDAEA